MARLHHHLVERAACTDSTEAISLSMDAARGFDAAGCVSVPAFMVAVRRRPDKRPSLAEELALAQLEGNLGAGAPSGGFRLDHRFAFDDGKE